jgi:hypothetical protein
MALGSATALLLELSGGRCGGVATLATYAIGYLATIVALSLLLLRVGLNSGAKQTTLASLGLVQARLR